MPITKNAIISWSISRRNEKKKGKKNQSQKGEKEKQIKEK